MRKMLTPGVVSFQVGAFGGIDVLSLALGAGIGAVVVAIAAYFGLARRKPTPEAPQEKQAVDFGAEMPDRAVSRTEIESARKDLRLYKMEKDYVGTVLARIYEAEARGSITKEERVALSQKYRIQIKDLEDKIAKSQITVDVSDLEDARTELISLVNQKISQIDNRLTDLREKVTPQITVAVGEKTVQQLVPPKEKKEKPEEPSRRPEIMDDRLKKVVQDVNEVMAKLEQMDLED